VQKRRNNKIKLMIKQLLIFLLFFISGNLFAQIDKIVGSWSETRSIRTDTLDSGREKLYKDYEAYRKGYKRLDQENDTWSYLIVPEENEKLKITIILEQDLFWAIDGNKRKEKIVYTAGFKEYLITIEKYMGTYSFIVKYDAKTDKLLFLDHRSEDICHEFERKLNN
jgi:hypothetical protein